MTKLGFHVASDKRSGAGDLLQAGAPLVVCVDQNMIAEAKRAGAVVAFRTQKGPGEDNPLGVDRQPLESIPAVALDWMQHIYPIWQQNAGADYYLPNNEWDIGDLASGLKINLFALECMKFAEARGLRLGVFNFATGNPSDDPVEGRPTTMEQRLDTVFPALQYAAEHGHAVSLHVHAMEHGDLQTTGEWIALRHQRFLRYCLAHGFRPKILITELSNGTGGVQPNMSRYLVAMQWWDQTVRQSEFAGDVVGGALYGFNAGETLTPAVPRLVKIMTSTPAPAPIDPTVKFRGTCLKSHYDRIAAQVVANGGTIEVAP